MGFKVYRSIRSVDDTSYYALKEGYTGKSHTVVRTGYKNQWCSGTFYNSRRPFQVAGSVGGAYSVDSDWNYYLTKNERNLILNNLVDKFEGKCGPSSALGASIFAEGKETWSACVQALEGAVSLVKAMTRRDIRGLKAAWDKRPRTPTSAMKAAGGKWLEFSFGWIPLVQTVYDAFAVTAGPIPPKRVIVSSRWESVYNEYPILVAPSWGHSANVHQFVKIGYDVTVDNPNTWLLGSLGLLNPGEWIWEAIPYSFFVDYFTNIGDLIHNLSAFAGLSFSNGFTTYYHKWDDKLSYRTYRWDEYTLRIATTGEHIGRRGPTPLRRRLIWAKNPLTSSWQRGLNASSFLAQRLK